MVYTYNDYGCIKLPALVTDTIMAGVISINESKIYTPSHTETYTGYLEPVG